MELLTSHTSWHALISYIGVANKMEKAIAFSSKRRYLMKRLISLSARPGTIVLAILIAHILAACSPAPAAVTPEPVLPGTGGGTVQIGDNPEFGPILVTADGMTLYTNTVDTPEDLRCTDITCTGIWPPYIVDAEPAAGEEIPGSLGTVTRPDGSLQVTYNQLPLYTFYLDNGPGDANGDGFTDFGGTWHVVPVEGSSGASSSGSGG
jgi:predicted lipoprotein with Yx(FWY)xxD motif